MKVDPDLVIPNKKLSINQGAIHASGWSKAEGGTIAQMYYEALGEKYGFLITAAVISIVGTITFLFAGFGVKEVRDAYEIRRAIESATLTRAVRNLSARHLAALKNDCDRMHAAIRLMRKCGMAIMTGRAEREFLESDLSFHMRLLKVSGNELAEKIIANAYRRNQFFGTHSHQRTLRHVALAWRFHCEILRCCRAKDAAGAVHWLSCHLERSEQDALLPIGRS